MNYILLQLQTIVNVCIFVFSLVMCWFDSCMINLPTLCCHVNFEKIIFNQWGIFFFQINQTCSCLHTPTTEFQVVYNVHIYHLMSHLYF